MGGSSPKDGLALYPLQWMLLESKAKGLVLEFDGTFQNRGKIDNPLDVVFPKSRSDGNSQDLWCCKMKNGLTVEMQDLRRVHDPGNAGGRYMVHLNRRNRFYMKKEQRKPFDAEGNLNGYCGYGSYIIPMISYNAGLINPQAPQGTVVHPSVYFLFDEYYQVYGDSKDLAYRDNIQYWRDTTLGSSRGFWDHQEMMNIEELGAIRILVCGNTGVGKSTLINEVFGVDVVSLEPRYAWLLLILYARLANRTAERDSMTLIIRSKYLSVQTCSYMTQAVLKLAVPSRSRRLRSS